jgi:hypothetical protein
MATSTGTHFTHLSERLALDNSRGFNPRSNTIPVTHGAHDPDDEPMVLVPRIEKEPILPKVGHEQIQKPIVIEVSPRANSSILLIIPRD